MDDLVTWLRDQLDDDWQVAMTAGQRDAPPWKIEYDKRGYDGKIVDRRGWAVVHQEDSTPDRETAEHIARWHPARALDEIDAKRRILAEVEYEIRDAEKRDTGDGLGLSQTVLALLALPYADRAGYRDEWKP